MRTRTLDQNILRLAVKEVLHVGANVATITAACPATILTIAWGVARIAMIHVAYLTTVLRDLVHSSAAFFVLGFLEHESE